MDTSNKSLNNSSKKDLLEILFEKKDLKCALCGRRLTPSTSIIDYKLPKSLGGSNDISNLQLVCLQCNAKKSDKPFLGYQFESYIKQLISAHPSYNLVDDLGAFGQWKSIPDIVCTYQQDKKASLLLLK